MRPLKIFLGDLSYFNDHTRSNLYVPVNIGYIASYAKKLFGNAIEITLFKDPNKLLEAAKKEKPEVVGQSFYYWNTFLNHAVAKQLRAMLGTGTTIVWGGPSVDTDFAERERLFRRFPEVDAYVSNEGELGFANIIAKRLEDFSNLWKAPIDGIVFIDGSALVVGEEVGLSLDLDELPSPYISGLLDSFLSGEFLPLLQTSRLCPYTCTFCVSGKNEGKLRAFPLEQVKAEIDYLTQHFKGMPHLSMHLVDENFGILRRDTQIADYILWSAESKGFPRALHFYNDKRFNKTARHVIGSLGHMTKYGLALSLQTENPETLKEIKRSNLTPEQIDEAIQWASEQDLPTTTELIFGLPYETKDSFSCLLNNAVKRGFDSILVNNLFIMDGIEMNHQVFRTKHKLKTRFRPAGTNYGYVGSTFCAESEEVVVGSDVISFEDFIVMRLLNFMFYAIFSMDFCKWFFQYIRQIGVPLADYLSHFVNCSGYDVAKSDRWVQFMTDLKEAALGELFDSRKAVEEHLLEIYKTNDNNVGKPTRVHLHYGSRLNYLETDWLQGVLLGILEQFVDPESDPEKLEIAEFLIELSKRERIELMEEKQPEPLACEFDVLAWKKGKFRRPLAEYQSDPCNLVFAKNPDFIAKIDGIRRSFSHCEPAEFCYNAFLFIIPKTQLLHNISYDKAFAEQCK
jgi:radical SAM superfamily enzyme YgiQ (UPF0313 family)